MNKAMGIYGIGGALHGGKIDGQPQRFRGLLNLRINFDRGLFAAKFAL